MRSHFNVCSFLGNSKIKHDVLKEALGSEAWGLFTRILPANRINLSKYRRCERAPRATPRIKSVDFGILTWVPVLLDRKYYTKSTLKILSVFVLPV